MMTILTLPLATRRKRDAELQGPDLRHMASGRTAGLPLSGRFRQMLKNELEPLP